MSVHLSVYMSVYLFAYLHETCLIISGKSVTVTGMCEISVVLEQWRLQCVSITPEAHTWLGSVFMSVEHTTANSITGMKSTCRDENGNGK